MPTRRWGFQVDLLGTWHVLEAARLDCQHGTLPPVRVLFPTTIASFGDFIAPGQLVPNKAVQTPTIMYGASDLSTAVKLFVDAVRNYPRPDQGARAVRRLKFRSGHADVS
jgi:hypothetical protein